MYQQQTLPKINTKTTVKDVLSIIKEKKSFYRKQLEQNQLNQKRSSYLQKQTPDKNQSKDQQIRSYRAELVSAPKNNHRTVYPILTKRRQQSFSYILPQDSNTQNQQKKKLPYEDLEPLSQLTDEQIRQQFKVSVKDIPKQIKNKTEQNMKSLLNLLYKYNLFFAKIHPMISVCMLKMNRIVQKNPHTILYHKDQQFQYFYIILCGRIKISSKAENRKKICIAGQTVGQESLFSPKIVKKTLQKATTTTYCVLLEIKAENYKKIYEEMVKSGFKVPFLQMQVMIKRNFIVKNWKRVKTNRLHTKI